MKARQRSSIHPSLFSITVSPPLYFSPDYRRGRRPTRNELFQSNRPLPRDFSSTPLKIQCHESQQSFTTGTPVSRINPHHIHARTRTESSSNFSRLDRIKQLEHASTLLQQTHEAVVFEQFSFVNGTRTERENTAHTRPKPLNCDEPTFTSNLDQPSLRTLAPSPGVKHGGHCVCVTRRSSEGPLPFFFPRPLRSRIFKFQLPTGILRSLIRGYDRVTCDSNRGCYRREDDRGMVQKKIPGILFRFNPHTNTFQLCLSFHFVRIESLFYYNSFARNHFMEIVIYELDMFD